MKQQTFITRLVQILGIMLVIVCMACGGYAIYRYFTFEQMIVGVPQSEILVQAYYESSNANDYDPHQISSASDEISMLYSGLVALNNDSQVIPDIAKSWEVNADGTVYTFHMRENAVFHDGKSVTAEDVKYSLERATSSELASQTAPTYLGDIKGFAEYYSGNALELSGVRVIDSHTIEITIDAAKPYFLYKLTYPTGYVLDKFNVEQGSDWFVRPNGTGPYALAEWEHGNYKLFKVNDKFYLQPAAIPYMLFWMSDNSPQDLYEQNALDMTWTWDVDRFSRADEPLHNELVMSNQMCVNFVVFDTTQPPFDDVHVRRAVSMATDRNQIIEKIYDGRAIANTGVFPQGLPGFNTQLKPLPFDIKAARAELALSRYKTFDELLFTAGGYANRADSSLGMYADMWRDSLGLPLVVQNLEPDRYIDYIDYGFHGQLFDGGWCADYPDPENFADALFHSGASQNKGKYSNPRVDALLDAARTERDVQKRIQLYQEAEQIIVDDAAVLFTATGTNYYLVKPYLKNYTLSNSTTNSREMRFDGKKWYLYKAALAEDYLHYVAVLSSFFAN
jgi:oligopeptide transport system substrate-binding protein